MKLKTFLFAANAILWPILIADLYYKASASDDVDVDRNTKMANATFPRITPAGLPIERYDAISDRMIDKGSTWLMKEIDAVANVVRMSGYRCDSVSAMWPYITAYGYHFSCNHSRYKYDVEDKGGNWIAKVEIGAN
jgi:hypothetical protein